MSSSRRDFISQSLLASAGLLAALKTTASYSNTKEDGLLPDEIGFKLTVFSKHLHWLDYNEMAQAAAQIGFDGVDLTVRPDGHVLPERVEEDLPKAYEAVKKAGLQIYSIVTAITDADDPLTLKILKTASGLGIKLYRLGWYHYDEKLSIEENIKQVSGKMKKLDALNRKYKIVGVNQNHSGPYFGAPVWDLAETLKHIDSPTMGSQYDVYHGTIEGMNSWMLGLQLMAPYVKMLDIKDFEWAKKDGKWTTESVPLGEGAVEWKAFFQILKINKVSIPVSIHYEYPLGGAENGKRQLTMSREQILAAMKKDLDYLRNALRESGLTS
jgi:L-ribulose-5-phosphate 3-epimerase